MTRKLPGASVRRALDLCLMQEEESEDYQWGEQIIRQRQL